jgi:hypothetical protein
MYFIYTLEWIDQNLFNLSRLMEDKLTQSVVSSTKYQIQSCFNSFYSKLLNQFLHSSIINDLKIDYQYSYLYKSQPFF